MTTGSRSSPRLSSGSPARLRAFSSALEPGRLDPRFAGGLDRCRAQRGGEDQSLALHRLFARGRLQRELVVVDRACRQHQRRPAPRGLLRFGVLGRLAFAAFGPAVPQSQPRYDDRDDRQRFAERDPAPPDRRGFDRTGLGLRIRARNGGFGRRQVIAHRGVPSSAAPAVKRVGPARRGETFATDRPPRHRRRATSGPCRSRCRRHRRRLSSWSGRRPDRRAARLRSAHPP